MVFKLFVFKNIFEISTLYIIIMDLILAILLTILETIFPKLINKIVAIILTSFVTILIIAQFIYFKYYDAIFSIYSLFHGAQVFGFMDSIISVILQNIVPVIILFIPLNPDKRESNTVFQTYALFPHMTVYENVALSLRLKKLPKEEREWALKRSGFRCVKDDSLIDRDFR